MKRLLLVGGFLAIASMLPAILPCASPLFAQPGCCKRRDSLKAPWYRIGVSFGECKQLNDQHDRDNVFDERGFYWWDSACR